MSLYEILRETAEMLANGDTLAIWKMKEENGYNGEAAYSLWVSFLGGKGWSVDEAVIGLLLLSEIVVAA